MNPPKIYTNFLRTPFQKDEKAQQILELLQEKDRNRGEICEILNLPRTTVYDILKDLEYHGYVERYLEPGIRRIRGRRKVFWRLK